MAYLLLKHLHVGSVILSVTLFALRGIGALAGSAWLEWRFLRIFPHVVDSVLLASAIGLAMLLHQYPFVHGWLTAKVLALVAYILLGMIALKRGRTRAVRAAAFVMALTVFGYIVSVARTRDPLGFLSLLAG